MRHLRRVAHVEWVDDACYYPLVRTWTWYLLGFDGHSSELILLLVSVGVYIW